MKPVVALFFVIFSATFASKAGIYLDNGYDQTQIDHVMSEQERQIIERELLKLLGLPQRPKRTTNGSLKRSAPKFLLDIYKSQMNEDDQKSRHQRSADLSFTGAEQNAIDQSDIIMSFEPINHHVREVRHERGKRLWFNVSRMPIAEDVVGAELRIYQTEIDSKNTYTVTLYELINMSSGEERLEYISSVNTTGEFSQWLKLNVTACLPAWVAFPDSNKGLYLSVHLVDKPGYELRLEAVGLVIERDGVNSDETQPFMVAFLKGTNYVQPTFSTSSTSKTKIKRSLADEKVDYQTLMKEPLVDKTSGTCRVHNLFISFIDLRWQDWIIAPTGFASYYCAGVCNFPLNAQMNATNHAIIQTLVHIIHPYRFPKPCCAPSTLTHISVLYFIDDVNVILKKFKKMSIKSCGCQ